MGRYSLGAAALAVLGVGAGAQAADPTTAELQAQIQALQAKVTQLEQVQTQAAYQANVKATVEAVLQDASRRSELFQGQGFTAGWMDGKFVLRSLDGNYLLHPYAQFQFRNTTTWRQNGKSDGSDDTQNGFEVRRMRLGIDGNVISPDLTYKFQLAIDRKSGTTLLEDAWVKYQIAPDWAIRGGQFPDPLAHDSIISTRTYLASDRMLVNDVFSPGDNYTQGVTAIYGGKGPLRIEAGFTDGAGNNTPNQNFPDFPTNKADFGMAGRLEYLVMGDWKNYADYTAMGTKNPLLVLGGGLDYTESGNTDFFTQTADIQYESPGGLGLYGAFYSRQTKNSPAGVTPPPTVPPTPPVAEHDLSDWGFFVQGSYLMSNQKFEPFVRYGFINFDSAGIPAGFDESVSEISAGFNYFLHGHNAKFTLDAGWLPNGSPVSDDGIGVLVNKDDEFYLRGQFQLLL